MTETKRTDLEWKSILHQIYQPAAGTNETATTLLLAYALAAGDHARASRWRTQLLKEQEARCGRQALADAVTRIQKREGVPYDVALEKAVGKKPIA
jgi:hypothetical protein